MRQRCAFWPQAHFWRTPVHFVRGSAMSKSAELRNHVIGLQIRGCNYGTHKNRYMCASGAVSGRFPHLVLAPFEGAGFRRRCSAPFLAPNTGAGVRRRLHVMLAPNTGANFARH